MTQPTPEGFTKPPRLGLHVTPWRLAGVAVFTGCWGAATWDRLHPVAVVAPPIVVAAIVFTTIYHVNLTRWAARWLTWRRHRRDVTALPDPTAVVDIPVDGADDIGVVIDDDRLVTMIALEPDPLAPTVVTATEERTTNTVTLARLAELLRLADLELESLDLITTGTRAAGGFADLYQQMVGPVPAASSRTSWLLLRICMLDNVAAIHRRSVRADAARRTAALACLRAADVLAAEGLDARPATAAEINAVNDLLHAEPPQADHWKYLEGRTGYTGVYYADPAHIAEDAAQWWTWPAARDITTLIRLRNTPSGHPQIAALVRYRTAAAHPAPPVSRLGPLHGVQRSAWRQFRVGSLPHEAPLPWSALNHQPSAVIPFGPTGPLIGSLASAGEKAAVHLPLAGPISVVCPNPLLLRQVALRATATGRPLIVITADPAAWNPIVANAAAGVAQPEMPDQIPADAILVIDGPMPIDVPAVTVLTSDASHLGDITLATDTEDPHTFTLEMSSGLSTQLRSVPSHEERRLLGVGAPATPPPSRQPRDRSPAPTEQSRPAACPAAPPQPAPAPPPRWGEAPTPAAPSRAAHPGRSRTPATPQPSSHLPPSPARAAADRRVTTPPPPPSTVRPDPDTAEEPQRWPNV